MPFTSDSPDDFHNVPCGSFVDPKHTGQPLLLPCSIYALAHHNDELPRLQKLKLGSRASIILVQAPEWLSSLTTYTCAVAVPC